MLPTRILLSQAVRVTLFTRAGCGLCDTAKRTVVNLNQRKQFDYSELDIMMPENKAWKDVYEFDVPVLHVQPSSADLAEAKKLFHRFTEQEIETLVDEAQSQNQ